ncbi:hypothetical protein MBLNU13_g09297t2 [Cladosporium sp. NU13]
MAATSFRDRMNDLGWSRREPPVVNTQRSSGVLGTLAQYNPFGGESYVQLPTHEGEAPGAPLPARTRREEEEGWFALSRWDRLLLFGGLNLAALALFVVCFTLFPILSLKPRKFAILYVIPSSVSLIWNATPPSLPHTPPLCPAFRASPVSLVIFHPAPKSPQQEDGVRALVSTASSTLLPYLAELATRRSGAGR